MPLRPGLFAGILLVAIVCAAPASAQYPEAPADSHRPRVAWTVPLRGSFESPFGYRWGRLHAGVDIAVLGDDRVHAALAGVVTAVGWLPRYSGYGIVVQIRHRDGVSTMYAHLARTLVHRGESVEAGELVGIAGCTGSCTGQHLHFEVHLRGRPVDPLRFLPRLRSVG